MAAMTYPVTTMPSMTASMTPTMNSAACAVSGEAGWGPGKTMPPSSMGGWNTGFSTLGGEQLGGLLGSQGYNMGHAMAAPAPSMTDKSHVPPTTAAYPAYFPQFTDPSTLMCGRVH